MKPFRSLQTMIIVLFVLPVVFSIALTAFLLNLMIKDGFDAEIGKRLTSIALATAAQMAEPNLLLLTPGAEKTRVYEKLREELLRVRVLNGLERIVIFRPDNSALLDTRDGIPVGFYYINNEFDKYEIESVKEGRAVASTYFEGEDGRPHKTGYAPVIVDGEVRAIIGIEASWDYFSKLKEVSHAAFWVGIVGVSIVILIGVVFSRTILGPIRSLAVVAEEIGDGNYGVAFPTSIHGELEQLVVALSKMREKILNREREMSMMLYGVAHEVRNPLSGMKLFTGILKDEVGNRNEIQRIDREIDYMEKVIGEFMTYAKSASPEPLHVEEVVVEEYLSEVLSLFAPEIQRSQIQVALQGGGIDRISCDRAIMKSVLSNLIKNAIQAMPSGGSLVIRWWRDATSTVFEVKDTGVGIRDEDRGRVFVPFFTTKAKGSGLGLSLVKKLLERHNGRVELLGGVGVGTIARVTIPRSPAEGCVRKTGNAPSTGCLGLSCRSLEAPDGLDEREGV